MNQSDQTNVESNRMKSLTNYQFSTLSFTEGMSKYGNYQLFFEEETLASYSFSGWLPKKLSISFGDQKLTLYRRWDLFKTRYEVFDGEELVLEAQKNFKQFDFYLARDFYRTESYDNMIRKGLILRQKNEGAQNAPLLIAIIRQKTFMSQIHITIFDHSFTEKELQALVAITFIHLIYRADENR